MDDLSYLWPPGPNCLSSAGLKMLNGMMMPAADAARELGSDSDFDLILGAIALAIDAHGLGVVQ